MTQNNGKISQIIGPVVDASFDGEIPPIYSALKINDPRREGTLVCEVAQHLGNNMVRSIALGPTEGLVRGMAVEDTGGPIKIPVGPPTLGREIGRAHV